jgi:hypothetical protein
VAPGRAVPPFCWKWEPQAARHGALNRACLDNGYVTQARAHAPTHTHTHTHTQHIHTHAPPTGELASARSVVVYSGFKSAADALAGQLVRAGVDAAAYHAGKNLAQREAVQARALGFRVSRFLFVLGFRGRPGAGAPNPASALVGRGAQPRRPAVAWRAGRGTGRRRLIGPRASSPRRAALSPPPPKDGLPAQPAEGGRGHGRLRHGARPPPPPPRR